MIGIFDSGLGGLTVVRRVREVLPYHDIVFFADQAHVPYGDRTVPDLLELLAQNITVLEGAGAQAIVAACNTSCAVAGQYGWPSSRIPVLDLIESAAIAVAASAARRVGVVATGATARSGSYARYIIARSPDVHVIEVAAPALVPLVEGGHGNTPESLAAVREACAPLAGAVDAIVLGCTHYPLVIDDFRTAAGPDVEILDPAIVHAERTVQMVRELRIPAGTGTLDCITNAALAAFEANVNGALGGAACRVLGFEGRMC